MSRNIYLAIAMMAVSLAAVSCNSKSTEESERIKALEEKISQLEQTSIATPTSAQNVEPADPSTVGAFDFQTMEYDFGTIPEGEVIEHVFSFKNSGQAPLVISNIQASCGCTSPDWTKTPIKPGDEGFVKVVFNSAGKTGVQSPTVTIQANTTPNVTRLRLKGTVNQRTASAEKPSLGPVKR
jgi:hypothetical protein